MMAHPSIMMCAMTLKITAIFLFILASLLPASAADTLHLSGNNHWLAIASSRDVNVAIGIARQFDDENTAPRVVSSTSGWYAVVAGPFKARSIAQLKKDYGSLAQLPADALLSSGRKYVKTVWQPAPANPRNWPEYAAGKPAEFKLGNLLLLAKMEKKGSDTFISSLQGYEKGPNGFAFDLTGSEEFSATGATAALLKLDPKSGASQFLATRYSGGAHCCTKTWIATLPEGATRWRLIEAATLDGGGYGFEDVDGDGATELISVDNAFLYAFDSYAASFAPVHIWKLEGTGVTDVSDSVAMRARLVQEIAGMEFQAKMNSDLWKSNGFLAAWVASKMRLGEGEAAWARMLASYDRNSDFGPQSCSSGQKVEDCPAENLKTIPFPQALAGFLREQKYGELPKAAQ
jgi:serine protease Do